MRILLTGGTGEVGKAVVERLVKKGNSVLVIGRKAGVEMEGAEYISCDINDYPKLCAVMGGCEVVVHLAAIPNPGAGTPEQIFYANCQGTFNVFQAAAEQGIRRVVQASSINAAGQYYGIKPAPLLYLPMDEAHPTFATDAYSFSKNIIEQIGTYFWQREGISSVALRLPYVAHAAYHETVKQSRVRIQALVGDLLKLSSDERLAWFTSAWEQFNNFRASRPYETKEAYLHILTESSAEDKLKIVTMTNRANFFTVLDERDSAQAIEKGLTASYEGSHTLFINDSHNWTGVESKLIAELFYYDVQKFTKPLVGTETIISIDQARRLIGFEPEFSFNEA